MEIKKRRLPFMAEGVINNTVPPLFTENLTINRLTKFKDFCSVTGIPVGAYCYFGPPLKSVFAGNSKLCFHQPHSLFTALFRLLVFVIAFSVCIK